MRPRLLALILVAIAITTACATTSTSTSSLPTAPASAQSAGGQTAEPTATVHASPTTGSPDALRSLPEGMSGIAQPGSPTALREPETTRGTFPPGVALSFTLGHCGLLAPIDFDGSLWDPIAGDDGNGGPLSDDHRIELFNATEVQLVLVDPNVARFTTPLGAVITLVRHDGPRAYNLCD